MVDSNKSYSLRLAEITFPLLSDVPAAISASSPPQPQARINVPEPAPPATAPPTVEQELRTLFGNSCEPPTSCLSSVQSLAIALELRPDVQSRLAVITQYTPSKWLLERELESAGFWPVFPSSREVPAPAIPLGPDCKPDAYETARFRSATGLCLSGGGIRSATFNLGILQALSRFRYLRKLDYISSVSGGGYIHQFLANWIHKAGNIADVETLLDPIPNAPGAQPRATVQPEPLRWLRRYSNYLAPRKGLFSLDSWTIVAVWVRNTALNLVVLLASLFFLLLLPHFGTMLYAPLRGHIGFSYFFAALLLIIYVTIAFLLYHWLVDLQLPGPRPLFVKCTAIALFLASSFVTPAIYRSSLPGGSSINPEARAVFKPVSRPAELHYKSDYTRQDSAESVHIAVDSKEPVPQSGLRANWELRPRPLWHYILTGNRAHLFFFLYLLLCAGFLTAVTAASQLHRALIPLFFIFGVIVSYTLVEGIRLLFFVAAFMVPPHLISSLGVVLLPAVIFGVPFITTEAGLGLIGRASDSSQREWLARARAFSFLFGGVWTALAAFSLLGPSLFDFVASYSRTGYTLWTGWLATSIGGVLSAKSTHTSRGPATSTDSPSAFSSAMEILAKVAPIVFVSGLLILIAKFASWSLVVSPDAGTPRMRFLLLAGVSLAVAVLFGWRVDINDFSMHSFYRDRLARCYAGATNPNRNPNRFTGFTRDDRDLRIHQLLPTGYTVRDEVGNPGHYRSGIPIPPGDYNGPFPIICTSINLTMGEDLAYQERKAASFVFTPLFSGFNVGWTTANSPQNQFNGFVPTYDYVYTREGGLMLATAVAISGAAASPNMGYHSNPAIAFLLTVFNVRLGWWLRNPRRRRIGRTVTAPSPVPPIREQHIHDTPFAPAHDAPILPLPGTRTGPLPSSPRFGLLSLMKELLGRANDTTSYIYLTDGGHFDNMGLYELLRRRCRNIVVCDGEADGHLHFEGIGMAIRKARLDFGIEVMLDQTAPLPEARKPGASAPTRSTLSQSRADPSSQVGGTLPGDPGPPAPFPGDEQQEDESQPAPQDLPFVISAHMSPTEPGEVTGTVTRQHPPAPTVEGLASFAVFPANATHCVHGTIRYPEDSDPSQYGHILYIKASLTGDEPADVLNYRRQHENFPHDTTLNQFFTESQFESYRRLGEHIALTDKTVLSWLRTYL